MVFYPVPTDRDFDIIVPIFSAVAFIATSVRLWDRLRTRHFGVDDVFAILAAIFHVIFLTVFYLFLQFPGPETQGQAVIVYYFLVSAFPAVLWSSRISIMLSVRRIVPYEHHRRRLNVIIFFFVVFWILLLIQPFWICESDPSWKTTGSRPQCDLGIQRAAFELSFDIVSDVALLIPPLSFLWQLKLQRGLRMRLIFLFSTSVFITIVSVIHDVLVLQVGGLPEIFAALLQDSIALFVCNLTVIVTAIFRKGSGKQETAVSFEVNLPKPEGSHRTGSKNKTKTTGLRSVLTWVGATTFEIDDDGAIDEEHALDHESDLALEDMTKRNEVLPSETSSVAGPPIYDDAKAHPFSGFSWQAAGPMGDTSRVTFSDGIVVSREVHVEEPVEYEPRAL